MLDPAAFVASNMYWVRAWLNSKEPERIPVAVSKIKSIGRVAGVKTVPAAFLITQEEIVPPALVIGKKLARNSPTGTVISAELPLEIETDGAPRI